MVKDKTERDALAEAIRARDEALSIRQRADAELEQFDSNLRETSGRAYRAEDALSEAKRELQQALRDHAGNEAVAAAQALRLGRVPYRDAVVQAERAYEQAEEALRLGKDGRHRVAGAKILADDRVEWAKNQVAKAAEVVLQKRLPELVAAADKARGDYLNKRAALLYVARNYDGVTSNTLSQDPLALRIRSFVMTFLTDDRNGAAPWIAATEALSRDPNAPIPE